MTLTLIWSSYSKAMATVFRFVPHLMETRRLVVVQIYWSKKRAAAFYRDYKDDGQIDFSKFFLCQRQIRALLNAFACCQKVLFLQQQLRFQFSKRRKPQCMLKNLSESLIQKIVLVSSDRPNPIVLYYFNFFLSF